MKRMQWLLLATIITFSGFAHSGFPVADIPAIAQRILDYLEQAKIALETANQYRQMIENYRNMVQNTDSLSNWDWDDASSVIDEAIELGSSIDELAEIAGTMDGFLAQYKTMNDYFSCGMCTEEIKAIRESSSRDQKRTYDASFRYMKAHQEQLKNDANTLEILQANAQSAGGRMQALQAANELLSNQSTQLLQIRALMQTQNTAVTMKMQGAMAEKSATDAANEYARSGTVEYTDDPGF